MPHASASTNAVTTTPGEASGVDSAVLTSIPASVTSVVLRPATPSRKALIIFNDSTSSVFVAFAPTASSSAFTIKMAGGSSYEFQYPAYAGAVSGIWETATGSARITETL